MPIQYGVDSGVLVAALAVREAHHDSCAFLIRSPCLLYLHGLSEAFSTLTGGRLAVRLRPAEVADLFKETVLPFAEIVTLSAPEVIAAVGEAEARGIRGGAIYDYLHLVAA